MLSRETSLRPKSDKIYGIEGSTRDSLDYLFSHLTKQNGKPFAIPLPSWHFWALQNKRQPNYTFSYFKAHNEDQFVTNFAKLATRGEVGSLVITNPSNPLQYSLSESAACAIDVLALRHGIEIVIDDVLRGTFPMGQRDSVARLFTRPYVVEGLSKRFGDRPLGDLSYIMVPQDAKLDFSREDIEMKGDRILINGASFDLAYRYASEPALAELRARNIAFDEGLRETCPDVTITRPCDSFLTSLIHLPTHTAENLAYQLYRRHKIAVSPFSLFYPDGYKGERCKDNAFRITVGHYRPDKIRVIGKTIGERLTHG